MPCIACLLWFSCLMHLGGMTLAAAGGQAQETRQPQAQTVLFFGDSLTAGSGLAPAQALPALIQAKIREGKIVLAGMQQVGGARNFSAPK